MSVGGAHTCALNESAELVCWGNNEFGQADAPKGHFRSVTSGGAHTCAVQDSGGVVCWGALPSEVETPAFLQ